MSDVAATGMVARVVDDLSTTWAAVARPDVEVMDLALAGVGMRIEMAGSALRQVVAPALEVHEGTGHPSPDVTICVWDCAATGTAMPGALTSLEPGPAWQGGDDRRAVHVLWDGHQCVVADLDAGRYLVAVLDARQLPWWEQGAPLRLILAWALASHGRRLVHAAAIGRPGGVVLLGAPGGHGKSSTAVSALLAGHHFLGDDFCILTDDGRVHPLYGTIKVVPQQLPVLDPDQRLAPHVIHHGSGSGPREDKTIAVASRAAPDLMLRSAPVAAVVVPSVGEPEGLERISPATALRSLAPTSVLMLRTGGGDDLAALAELVRRVPCRRLGLSPDRAVNPRVLGSLLDELGVRPRHDPA